MKCNWPLGNGQHLEFDVIENNEVWKAMAGLYIFTYQLHNGNWRAIYIGQTNNFSMRMPNHDRMNEAALAGATHIHAKSVFSQQDRDLWESNLINHLQPPLNQHHRHDDWGRLI